MTPLKHAGLLATIIALWAVGSVAMAAELDVPVQGQLTLTITSSGITGGSDVTTGGLYVVTVRNESNQARGLILQGMDLCCSPYKRFTQVLDPGREITFRWFFPSDTTLTTRDLLQCKPIATTCGNPVLGTFSRSITFR